MEVATDETFEPWSSKRTSILSTYTTSERIPITTSFLTVEEREKREQKSSHATCTHHVLCTPTLRTPHTLPLTPHHTPLTVETKAQAASVDKVKSRLEQLDDIEEGSVKETLNLNQQEYLRKIEDLNQNLVNCWDNDQRVKALKIAIQVRGRYAVWVWIGCSSPPPLLQCSKLLIDVAVVQFYPSKFVLITDILDNFGQ